MTRRQRRAPLVTTARFAFPALASLPLLWVASTAHAQTLPPGPEEEAPVVGPPGEPQPAAPKPEPEPKAASTEDATSTQGNDSAWLVGAHLGYSLWTDKGLPENSTAIGLRVGYRYTPSMELELRGRYIKSGTTGISASSGWSVSAANLWFVDLSDAWELGIGVGAGYESHRTKLRTNRAFLHGRVAPLVRWLLSTSFALDVGPELGIGVMSSEGTAGANQSDEFVARYGGFVNFSWRWGSGGSSGDDSTTNSDDSW